MLAPTSLVLLCATLSLQQCKHGEVPPGDAWVLRGCCVSVCVSVSCARVLLRVPVPALLVFV